MGTARARALAGNGPQGLLHGDLHLFNVLRAGRSRGLVAIDPRPGVGDLTFDAIDWTLDRATSMAEVHERIERLGKLVPGLDPDRLWGWCQATAAALAILLLRRRPPDATTQLLLEIAASQLERSQANRIGSGRDLSSLAAASKGAADMEAAFRASPEPDDRRLRPHPVTAP